MNDEIRMTNDESNPSVEWQPRIRGSSERSEGYSSASQTAATEQAKSFSK